MSSLIQRLRSEGDQCKNDGADDMASLLWEAADAFETINRREETLRENFEWWASDHQTWPKAVERDRDGDYLLMQTASDWMAWKAAWKAFTCNRGHQS